MKEITVKEFICDNVTRRSRHATYGNYTVDVYAGWWGERHLEIYHDVNMVGRLSIWMYNDGTPLIYRCRVYEEKLEFLPDLLTETASSYDEDDYEWRFKTWDRMNCFIEKLFSELKRLSRKGGS